jgi:hypothetical protein
MNPPIDTAKAIDGLCPSFSSHVRFGERGAPVDSPRYAAIPNKLGMESRGIPHLAKNERDVGHPRIL